MIRLRADLTHAQLLTEMLLASNKRKRTLGPLRYRRSALPTEQKPTKSWSRCEFVILKKMLKNATECLKNHIFELQKHQ